MITFRLAGNSTWHVQYLEQHTRRRHGEDFKIYETRAVTALLVRPVLRKWRALDNHFNFIIMVLLVKADFILERGVQSGFGFPCLYHQDVLPKNWNLRKALYVQKIDDILGSIFT
jgi:hypothetical protein